MTRRDLRVGVLVSEVLTLEMLLLFLSETAGCEPFAVANGDPDLGQSLPDVLITSHAMLVEAVESWRGVPVIALIEGTSPRASASALRHGASGVMDSACSLEDLAEAVRVVAAGQTWIPSSQVSSVLAILAEGNQAEERAAVLSLTSRELQVLVLLGRGLSRQEIAERLYVSPHTVRTHVQNVLLKLGLHSQLAVGAAARHAIQAGWIRPDP